MNLPLNEIVCEDSLKYLKGLPDESVDCVVTSPPYWALRDYGVDGQLGLEPTFQEYINKLCDIFDEVKRVLKKTGTCWVNLGDTYAGNSSYSKDNTQGFARGETQRWRIENGVAIRNKRTVWSINTSPFKDAHFAVFPKKLVEPCIDAGCPELICPECGTDFIDSDERGTGCRLCGKMANSGLEKGVVLDIFGGSGTTQRVAQDMGMDWLYCDLNKEYCDIAEKRLSQQNLL